MNWLAHTFLSRPDLEFRLGNLLADLVRGPARVGMSEAFVLGAECHKAIDAFTDAHPIVRRSRARVSGEYRRFSGVLVDVFYDYFLARSWSNYAEVSLDTFTTDFYADIREAAVPLPEQAQVTVDRIIRYDLLGSYRQVEGVEHALRRISTYLSTRWRRPFALEKSVSDLHAHEAEFATDFAEFFPELQQHIAPLTRRV